MSFVMLLVLSILWGGIVAVAAAGIQRLGLSGRTRQMMWRCASLMLLAPFPVALIYACVGPGMIDPVWNYGEGQAPSIPVVLEQMPVMAAPTVQPVNEGFSFEFDLASAAIVFLALGWMFRAFRARWARKELERITSKSEQIRSHAVLSSARFWQDRLGLKRKTDFRLLPGDYSPFTQGVLKPVVYLPNGLERELSHEEMALVVGHELMHIRRLDAIWRPLERVVADVLWFNPFAWLVRKELDRAREIACDEAMLVSKAPAIVYARALVAAARFAEGLPTRAPAAAMFPFNNDKELTERVKIAVAHSEGSSSLVGLAAFVVFLAAGLPLAAAQGAGGEKVRAPIPDFVETIILSEKAKISSSHGKVKDPDTGEIHQHVGVDIVAKRGTPVHSPANGVVTFSGEKKGYGKVVQVSFNAEWQSRSAQLSQLLVEEGQSVMAGDVIGLIGDTGAASRPHLHFELYGPRLDYAQSGKKISYDPERMGVALIPALELRAQQIRELGVVLPKQRKASNKIVDQIAPLAPPAPKAPEPPAALVPLERVDKLAKLEKLKDIKVTGITYLDDGEVKILDDGKVFIEFNPTKGDLVPKLVKSKTGKWETKKYTYKEANGDYVKIYAGTSDIPVSKLGVWVNGDKIEDVDDWFDWRDDVRDALFDEEERNRERREHQLERKLEVVERRLEANAEALEDKIENWAEQLEHSIEAEAEALVQSIENSFAYSEKHAEKSRAKAQAHAEAFAEAQIASSEVFAKNWTWAGQEQAAKAQVVALEQALTSLDAELKSINEQCDAAEKKTHAGAKHELEGLEMAKLAIKEARTQVAGQLNDARLSLRKQELARAD